MENVIEAIEHLCRNEVRPLTHTARVHSLIWHISTWPGCSWTFTGHDLWGEGQSSHQRRYQSAKVKRKDKEHTPGLGSIDHSHGAVVKIQPSTRQHIRQQQPLNSAPFLFRGILMLVSASTACSAAICKTHNNNHFSSSVSRALFLVFLMTAFPPLFLLDISDGMLSSLPFPFFIK